MPRLSVVLLACLAAVSLARPAGAQVVIESAPGAEGASMEPTYYLNTETARILPANLMYVSLAGGYDRGLSTASLRFDRGMGAGGELQLLLAGLFGPNVVPVGEGPALGNLHWDVGLGYKQRVAILGPWDVALHGYFNGTTSLPRVYGVQLDLPCTTELGPGD